MGRSRGRLFPYLRQRVAVGVVAALIGAGLAVGGPAAAAPPANDDFASAETITGSSGTVNGSNVDATAEPGEPGISGGPTGSVWYEWVAPLSGAATFDTCSSAIDTTLIVATGTAVNDLTIEGSNDDTGVSPCRFQSRVKVPVRDGTTYSISVDGVAGQTGNITLNWDAVAGPANDDFANAQTITGASGSVEGTNENATGEVGEPFFGSFERTNSVWYSWVAPVTGTAEFQACTSDFDTILGVFTGTDVDDLEEIAINDDACGLQSRMRVPIGSGETYFIAIQGFGGEEGTFGLKWASIPRRPDLVLKLGDNIAGEDVYTSASPDDDSFEESAFEQTLFQRVKRGKSATFALFIDNEGAVADDVELGGCGSSKGYKVEYTKGFTDVTAEVLDGTYQTGPLGPGDSHLLFLRVKVSKKAKGFFDCILQATSDGPTFDAVDLGVITIQPKR